jgi:hypothetical protein
VQSKVRSRVKNMGSRFVSLSPGASPVERGDLVDVSEAIGVSYVSPPAFEPSPLSRGEGLVERTMLYL